MTGLLDTLSSVASAYAATVAIGLVCAYLGLFTVLRRIVFTGVALAQLARPPASRARSSSPTPAGCPAG
jgi:ABC-type Mn2+/Zn2+ transport system permease subunit